MAVYQRKNFAINNRARRLIGAIANFVQDCDNSTFYRFSQEVRAILDAIETADYDTLAYLHYQAKSNRYSM